ncbi:outer membrane chaperone Skp (OmpH) [Roseivivax halodurans JCM 10272]|uniref:Outer membrane chaperone Skp (OmpH) n=1 Tax=Roseivivax halodurans JCM 10272 TaxID=1449350 RepID=X7EKJ5_9RHOB|nr:OmpH family outer membrane protein [Roseivivax halodurans]ETX16629.1 outer membrane chaperone Skp (OmpH) [Roseivivax halodurans JCM 10272]
MIRARHLLAPVLCLAAGLAPAQQQGPTRGAMPPLTGGEPVGRAVPGAILTVEIERLLQESAYGQRVLLEIEKEGRAIAAESERIAEELRREEEELTERRDGMEPEAFREAADAFNAKVQELRARQDQKAQEFGLRTEQARRQIIAAARPILQSIMEDAGGAVLVERRQTLLSADGADITDAAIAELDAEIGDGSDLTLPDPGPADEDAMPSAEDPGVPILPQSPGTE